MAPHSSTLAWKIPWMEEPGRLQSMGSLRVGHDWATSLSLSCIGEGNGNPVQCPCLENPRDGGAWWAAVYGVTQSQTRLKRLSSNSSSSTWEGLKTSCFHYRSTGSVPSQGTKIPHAEQYGQNLKKKKKKRWTKTNKYTKWGMMINR